MKNGVSICYSLQMQLLLRRICTKVFQSGDTTPAERTAPTKRARLVKQHFSKFVFHYIHS